MEENTSWVPVVSQVFLRGNQSQIECQLLTNSLLLTDASGKTILSNSSVERR